jgi:hypothetical protein
VAKDVPLFVRLVVVLDALFGKNPGVTFLVAATATAGFDTHLVGLLGEAVTVTV